MKPSVQDWHSRFEQQAGWTRQLRQYLLPRLGLRPGAKSGPGPGLGPSSRILEVGCGTGVITTQVGLDSPARVYGVDLRLDFLRLARQSPRLSPGQSAGQVPGLWLEQKAPNARFLAGDALRLPFAGETFDAVVCHFFLLWIAQPAEALAEMKRVTRPGGGLAAFAEPDYGGRIDYPAGLAELGRLQAEALHRQGADPNMGRKLSGLFHAAGLREIETGLLGGQWTEKQPEEQAEEAQSEWATLADDLQDMLPARRLEDLRRLDASARAAGERVLFVPTFYAWGKK